MKIPETEKLLKTPTKISENFKKACNTQSTSHTRDIDLQCKEELTREYAELTKELLRIEAEKQMLNEKYKNDM